MTRHITKISMMQNPSVSYNAVGVELNGFGTHDVINDFGLIQIIAPDGSLKMNSVVRGDAFYQASNLSVAKHKVQLINRNGTIIESYQFEVPSILPSTMMTLEITPILVTTDKQIVVIVVLIILYLILSKGK